MPHFKSYDDGTMRPRLDHTSGSMINQKPILLTRTPPVKRTAAHRRAVAGRMGQLFADRIFQIKNIGGSNGVEK
jgi:hypothetical protein